MNQNLVLKIHSPLYTANLFDTRTNTANQLGTPALVVILLITVLSFLGSGPHRGRSPVEWGGFPSRCSNFSKKLSKPHCYTCPPVHDFVVVKTALLYSTSVNAGISCWVECGKTAERCNWCGSGSCCRQGWAGNGCSESNG